MTTALIGRVCAALVALCLAPPVVAHAAEHAKSLFQFDGASGYSPGGGVIADRRGTIFGTTSIGGTGPCDGDAGCGTVFALSPPPHGSTAWVFDKLYDFQGGQDGSSPYAQLTLGPAGSLFGYTTGGTPGSVWQLVPPATSGNPWQFHILYVFPDAAEGNLEAVYSPLILHQGALYGIASGGAAKACGQFGCGSVFRLLLRRGASAWSEETLFRFTGDVTGGVPTWIVGFDAADALYVSTSLGHGAVIQIAPPDATGGGWTETVLTRFGGGDDGHMPGNLVLANGTLFGLASAHRTAFAFALAPPAASGAGWTRTRIADIGAQGYGPVSLARGAGGTLIGAIEGDFDFFAGSVFRLIPPPVGGPWTVSELWNFNRGPDRNPLNVVTGRGGDLFGVLEGGDSTNGSAFELR